MGTMKRMYTCCPVLWRLADFLTLAPLHFFTRTRKLWLTVSAWRFSSIIAATLHQTTMFRILIVPFFVLTLDSLAYGGSVSIASIPGVYTLDTKAPRLPFCTSRLDVRMIVPGRVSPSDLVFNGRSDICTSGSWNFVLTDETADFTNTAGSVTNLARSSSPLKCSSYNIVSVHFFPTVDPTVVSGLTVRGGFKTILLVARTGFCLYQKSKPPSKPRPPVEESKILPLDPGGKRIADVPKSNREYLKWLIPLIVALVVTPFLICCAGLCWNRARRKNGDVQDAASATQSTSKPNQTPTYATTHSSTNYSQTSHSPHHTPAPYPPPGYPPYYPASPPHTPPTTFAPRAGEH